jgi:hypothetical protein
MENLTTEELMAILEQRKAAEKKVKSTPQVPSKVSSSSLCLYAPLKPKNAPQCVSQSETPYGYCKKHSTTVQAKKAREQYEAETFLDEPVKTKSVPDQKIIEPIAQPEPIKEVPQEVPVVGEKHTPKIYTHPHPVPQSVSKSLPQTAVKESVQQKVTSVVNNKAIRKKVIRPNFWGRYEDPDTRIVFDPKTKSAYGVQESTGKVSALKQEHIDICKRNLWTYHSIESSSEEDEPENESSEEGSNSDEEDTVNSSDDSSEDESDESSEEDDSDESEDDSDEDSDEEDEDSDESSN